MERNEVRRASALKFLFGLAGLIVAFTHIPTFGHLNVLIFVILVFLGFLLEALPIPLRENLSTLIPVVPISTMVVYGSDQAIWIVCVVPFITTLILRDWNWLTAFFNSGQYVLSVWLMTIGYHLFLVDDTNFSVQMVLAIAVASLVFLSFNHLFIHTFQYFRGTFEKEAIWSTMATDLINLAVCLPFSYLMIASSLGHPLIGPIVILPIVVLAYVLRVHRQTRDMQTVHGVLTTLQSEFDPQMITSEIAKSASRMTLSDAIVVFSVDNDSNRLVPTFVYPQTYQTLFQDTGYPKEAGGVIWNAILGDKQITNIADARRDERVKYSGDKPDFLSMAVFPMVGRTGVQGALVCYARRTHAFGYSTSYVSAIATQGTVLLENAKMYQELHDGARRDAVTGLYNYRFFHEELNRSVQMVKNQERSVSVIIVDIDHFKTFNDTYGHLAGDAVLHKVGWLLSSIAEDAGGFVARYGGEEFVALVLVDRESAKQIAERIRLSVAELDFDFQGYQMRGITVSVGVACGTGSDQSDLLLKADSAMYWGAKQRGRNRVALYTPEYDTQLFVDPLTGLYTPHLLELKSREQVVQGNVAWGIICLDMLHFSQINETFGFEVGNHVLRQVGILIRERLRTGELACRYQGDKMIVLLPQVSIAEADRIRERMTSAITAHKYQINTQVTLTVHVKSVATVLTDVQDSSDLIARVSTMFSDLERRDEEVGLGS